ncbi:Hsp20/alpha crystallin family protein [Microbacterium sp. zg.Y1090]|uniref:Hsp20/alpha crystallin family protein n=1 Tax=Microbacterium TaxID=33882 RepID=UPI00214C8859|nr:MULTISPECIES: Hsp20/alpha crystallin family protein [unclassified Microbacterium]MCR2812436.1 Hsp20/alpha crystallin family protein [Microbacterium sp. zg.Y1084]MCR2817763.1 Hsp20/alpha crystallin family protein [Microbacterium sp. zg.Y1090]MDL5485593.1 Hsp20/alpha crystallin family protein [Microbacterium sp. zg-Y1211]WIM28764.1 Hsp20/alpha crystallin family protein [Microbacterium sp. zg-Y1090]
MANYDPLRDLERFANTLMDPARRGPRQMPMDLYREGDHYVLEADLPGIDPGSVDIDVDGQLLTIRAERTINVGEGVKWITREREAGSFLRQLSLGQGLDTERIAATYRNGVLSVKIPVSEKAKPRKVEVTTEDSNPSMQVSESPQA